MRLLGYALLRHLRASPADGKAERGGARVLFARLLQRLADTDPFARDMALELEAALFADTVIRMVPSMYGHTSDPTFPEEHGFETRQAAENRCRELRNKP